ncbi:MAG: spermidine synthase [bacterium]|nr:spermidine synthase [bacterium]
MPVLYAVTLGVSALLLFLVQPMVGKMILPALGGAPAVWNTCMVFFQAVLLAGYAYAHGSVGWLGARRQAGLHMVLLLLPLVALPIVIVTDSVPSSADNPVFWLLCRLALGVGLPFFVISTNAPVLQMWFSATSHRSAKDPYFLYSASNAGSMLALLGYPLIVEPLWALPDQSLLWAGGYILLVGLALVCAVVLWRSPRAADASTAPGSEAIAEDTESPREASIRPVTALRRLRWIVLAFVPSSLMLGVTTHVTTDVAPVPLLWVVPLAIYLLSFILVFARPAPLPHRFMVTLLPFVVAPVALMTVQNVASLGWLPVPADLVLLFVVAMVCHGEMAEDRPAPRHLTEFFLWMSFGGVLGGLFNAIVAPLAFDTLLEYPLVMVLACLVLFRRGAEGRRGFAYLLDVGVPIGVGLAVAGLLVLLRFGMEFSSAPLGWTVLAPAALCVLVQWVWERPLRFGLSLGAALVVTVAVSRVDAQKTLYEGRNFYGCKSVRADPEDAHHEFAHGSTVHGAQWTDPRGRRTPLTYFHPTGPVGDAFRTYNTTPPTPRVAIIGLGVGAMATYAKSGQHFDFYEIDPEVERVASDPALFTYLQDCRGTHDVILGDGRLTLQRMPDGHYGAIFLDAFSSDAVPTHLLTREAMEVYLSKLDDRGIVVFNITNRYLDLAPLLANLAEDAELVCLSRYDPANTPGTEFPGKSASRFLVMARRIQDIRRLEYDPNWEQVPTDSGVGVWTDQFTNILRLVRWR